MLNVTNSLLLSFMLVGLFVMLPMGSDAWPKPNGGWSDVASLVGLGPSRMGVRTLALVDWNNDKRLDMVVGADDNRTVLVYLWSDADVFSQEASNYTFASPIVSAIAADINRDGQPDLVVALTSGKLAFLDGATRAITPLDISSGPSVTVHPESPQLNVLDVTGHCGLLDLVVLSSTGSFYLLRNNLRSSSSNCDFIGGIPTFTSIWLSDMHLPNSRLAIGTGGVDFDGDCKSDFIFPTSYSSSNGGTITYGIDRGHTSTKDWFSVPSFVGMPSFADINGDGATDILFPSCTNPLPRTNGSDVYVCAGYNSVLVLNNFLSGDSVCSSSSCCSGHSTGFPSAVYREASGAIVADGQGTVTNQPFGCASFVPRNTSSVNDIRHVASEPHLLDTPQYPAVLRPTDVNKDNLADIIASTEWGPMILTSRGGGAFSCQPADASRISLDRTDSLYLSSIAFGFDLQEDGSVDLVGFGTQQDGGLGTIAYFNGIDTGENYFLTALMTNGVKGGDVGYPAWGALQVGGVHRFQWQDINTNLQTASMTHHATSAGFSLPMGRCHFGLGMTFSYIQGYSTGLRITGGKGFQPWSAYLVPNSQVVVLANPITDPSSWVLKLFLYPSKFKQLILIALPTALALIGVPILLLKYREVRSDRKDRQEEMH